MKTLLNHACLPSQEGGSMRSKSVRKARALLMDPLAHYGNSTNGKIGSLAVFAPLSLS
jgi:hypothetical protein